MTVDAASQDVETAATPTPNPSKMGTRTPGIPAYVTFDAEPFEGKGEIQSLTEDGGVRKVLLALGKADVGWSKPQPGDTVQVLYSGRLECDPQTGEAGTQFDSNLDRANPFSFTLGKGLSKYE